MSRRPRRNHSAAFKAKVAIEALADGKTIAEIAQKHDVHPNQVTEWRRQLMERAAGVFGGAAVPASRGRAPRTTPTRVTHMMTAPVLSSRMGTVVLDTNVLVAALLRGGGTGRAVLRACLRGQYQPVLGPALLAEYEDVLGRSELFIDSVLSAKERGEVFDGLMSRCRWVEVFYAWRPNLPDEADNHLIELAVAAQASVIVTRNLRDVARGELKFPMLRVLTPEQCLEAFPCPP